MGQPGVLWEVQLLGSQFTVIIVTSLKYGIKLRSRFSKLNIKHQHSLESYQLYKAKLAKIRAKQADMPGWGEAGGGSATRCSPAPVPSPSSIR